MGESDELRRLRLEREHNVAVSNGRLTDARAIARQLDVLDRLASASTTPRRNCVRCGVELYGTDPHLCKDVAARLARRERQVQAVLDMRVIAASSARQEREYAEAIVKRLANLGIDADD